jgi:hypothetical protein
MESPLEPSLKVGALCEQVLEQKDGVISIIRLIDRLVITFQGKDVPKELPPGITEVTAVMCWVNGLGDYEAKVNVKTPDNEIIESGTLPFRLDSLESVHNQVVKMTIPVRVPGHYWFEFILNEEMRGRVPLHVIYQRKQMGKRITTVS